MSVISHVFESLRLTHPQQTYENLLVLVEKLDLGHILTLGQVKSMNL